jgi:hypothetical protein
MIAVLCFSALSCPAGLQVPASYLSPSCNPGPSGAAAIGAARCRISVSARAYFLRLRRSVRPDLCLFLAQVALLLGANHNEDVQYLCSEEAQSVIRS